MLSNLVLFSLLTTGAVDFDYQRLPTTLRDVAEIRDITYQSLDGRPTGAYLVRPAGPRKNGPGVLFVHWYEPDSPDSNRTQFLTQAVELARSGVTSLLIETMWSEPKWFPSRDRSKDYSSSVQAVKDLRRALDVLLAQPGVDPKRIAYVGHDFGAMYGAVLAGVDRRVSVWALQAGTTSFSDWFLLGEKPTPEQRQAIIDQLAPLDPVKSIGLAAPAPVLLQFGTKDPYVPKARAEAFFDAAKEPKQVKYYEAGHPLNNEAIRDRQAWLKQQLGLR